LEWSRLMLVIVCGGRDVPPTGATRLSIVAITVVSCGRGPLKVLLVLPFAALDALLIAMGGDVIRRSFAAAQGCLPASLGRARHDRLIVGSVLGGNAAWCLECVPKKVSMLTLAWALCTVATVV
jgi:hypothetical protein